MTLSVHTSSFTLPLSVGYKYVELKIRKLQRGARQHAHPHRDGKLIAVVVRAVDRGVEAVDLRADAQVRCWHLLGEPGEVLAAHRGLRQLEHVLFPQSLFCG